METQQRTVLVASAFQSVILPVIPRKCVTRTGFMLATLNLGHETSQPSADIPPLICFNDMESGRYREAKRLFKHLLFLADQINADQVPAYPGYQLAEIALGKRVAFDLPNLG